jgi:putative lipoic acid-binding regulatory protein
VSEQVDAGVTQRGLMFPTAHVLIAMGPPHEAFRESLQQALLAVGARRTDTPIEFRLSRTGRYQSVHIEVHVDSREELEALYLAIKAHPDVVYRL